MYKMTCDGHPLLDARDDDFILGSPRVKNEVNTVGEGSFKIYFNHPNIDKLHPLLSVFEVEDEYGVIFRGRMTEDTKDFDNCKAVDLEGVMSYFNDSVVRPYVFPDDFEDDVEYKVAAEESPEQAAIDGGVVRFFLAWLIEQHNAQVETFQQFKLGNVTVYDKNNFIERAASEYPSTWKEISDKLFNSSLGGFLCIRYESDGNYIDYLREFTEVNEQGIIYGENMLDISQNTNAGETYSAVIPLGAEESSTVSDGEVYEGMYGDIAGGSTVERKLTIEDLPDGNITDDIVKKGDMLYSKSAVASYGLRIAPTDKTTWDEVETPQTLQENGVKFLEGDSSKIPNTIKVTAVDLNCTDSEIMSFRIYKKIPVLTEPHGVNADFDLTALDIDLLDPQNTKITVGKTATTMTEYQTRERNNIQKALSNYVSKRKVNKAFERVDNKFNEYAKTTDLIPGPEGPQGPQGPEGPQGPAPTNEELLELIKQALANMNIITDANLDEKVRALGYIKAIYLEENGYVTEEDVGNIVDEIINGGDIGGDDGGETGGGDDGGETGGGDDGGETGGGDDGGGNNGDTIEEAMYTFDELGVEKTDLDDDGNDEFTILTVATPDINAENSESYDRTDGYLCTPLHIIAFRPIVDVTITVHSELAEELIDVYAISLDDSGNETIIEGTWQGDVIAPDGYEGNGRHFKFVPDEVSRYKDFYICVEYSDGDIYTKAPLEAVRVTV